MAKMVIDGVEYDPVTPDSLTIGENRIVKRYTGVSGEQLEELPSSDPDLTAAMIHIAFMRQNPAASFAAIERRVDAVKYSMLDFTDDEVPEGPAEDPLEAPKLKSVDDSSNGAKEPSSTTPGTVTSAPSVEIPEPTGTPI